MDTDLANFRQRMLSHLEGLNKLTAEHTRKWNVRIARRLFVSILASGLAIAALDTEQPIWMYGVCIFLAVHTVVEAGEFINTRDGVIMALLNARHEIHTDMEDTIRRYNA